MLPGHFLRPPRETLTSAWRTWPKTLWGNSRHGSRPVWNLLRQRRRHSRCRTGYCDRRHRNCRIGRRRHRSSCLLRRLVFLIRHPLAVFALGTFTFTLPQENTWSGETVTVCVEGRKVNSVVGDYKGHQRRTGLCVGVFVQRRCVAPIPHHSSDCWLDHFNSLLFYGWPRRQELNAALSWLGSHTAPSSC